MIEFMFSFYCWYFHLNKEEKAFIKTGHLIKCNICGGEWFDK